MYGVVFSSGRQSMITGVGNMFEKDFNEVISKSDILLKHKDLLKTLGLDRVMCVGFDGEDYYIIECCDELYKHFLSKEECIELSELFKDIADSIKE